VVEIGGTTSTGKLIMVAMMATTTTTQAMTTREVEEATTARSSVTIGGGPHCQSCSKEIADLAGLSQETLFLVHKSSSMMEALALSTNSPPPFQFNALKATLQTIYLDVMEEMP